MDLNKAPLSLYILGPGQILLDVIIKGVAIKAIINYRAVKDFLNESFARD
jgi:hypothetical protein